MNKRTAIALSDRRESKGFTLIELLLGVTISVMIFLATGSVIALLFRTDIKSKNIESLEQTKNNLSAELTTSARWGELITIIGGQELIVDSSRYTLLNGKILKNNEPLTSNDITITRFEIKDFSNSTKLKSLEIRIDMQNKNFTSVKDTFNIVVSQRQREFDK